MSTTAGSTLPAMASAFAGPAPETVPPPDGASGAATGPDGGVTAVGLAAGRRSVWVIAAPPTAPATTRATTAALTRRGGFAAAVVAGSGDAPGGCSAGATQSGPVSWVVWRVTSGSYMRRGE